MLLERLRKTDKRIDHPSAHFKYLRPKFKENDNTTSINSFKQFTGCMLFSFLKSKVVPSNWRKLSVTKRYGIYGEQYSRTFLRQKSLEFCSITFFTTTQRDFELSKQSSKRQAWNKSTWLKTHRSRREYFTVCTGCPRNKLRSLKWIFSSSMNFQRINSFALERERINLNFEGSFIKLGWLDEKLCSNE